MKRVSVQLSLYRKEENTSNCISIGQNIQFMLLNSFDARYLAIFSGLIRYSDISFVVDFRFEESLE